MKRLISCVLALAMLLSMLVIPAMGEEVYREPITLTMFSELANYAGEQQGWFAKELKDRFNVTLKYVSTNVDSNAWTSGVSAGDLGDIICLGDMGDHFLEALKADLILDWDEVDLEPYTNINTYLKDAIQKTSDFAAANGFDGTYGFNFSVAMEDGAWAELVDPTYALQVRFDAGRDHRLVADDREPAHPERLQEFLLLGQ